MLPKKKLFVFVLLSALIQVSINSKKSSFLVARGLSEQGMEKVLQLRNRIQDTLYALLKEITEDKIPSSRFGNLLLFIPILTSLSIVVNENIRFAQTFSSLGRIPLLISLFGCFPVEPFLDVEDQPQTICKTVETQTDDIAGPPEPPVPQVLYFYFIIPNLL